MNTNEIEKFVDGITSTHAETKIRTTHSKRAFKRMSPLGVVLIAFATVGLAVLGGYFYSLMTVEQTGTVNVGGRELTSVFEWDGIPIEGGMLSLPLDVANLTVNDHKSFNHTIANMDMGDWLVTIHCTPLNDIENDPMHPLYGINFTASPNNFLVSPEETIPITFYYNVSHEFMDPVLYNGTTLNEFTVEITIQSVSPPMANDDGPLYYNAGASGTLSFDILINDVDNAGGGLTVTEYDWVGESGGMVLSFHDGRMFVTGFGGVTGPHVFTYTVEDMFGLTDTATVTIIGQI